MTYKPIALVFFLFFVSFYSFASNDTEPGKRKISNELYSITIPSDWEPTKGTKGDGIVPDERDGDPYHLYFIGWNSDNETLENGISFYIQSYQRLDGISLSVADVEAIDMAIYKHPLVRNIKRTDIKSKSGQRRYVLVKEEASLFGKYHKSRTFSLIQKGKNVVHLVHIFLSEYVYQKQPSVQKMINEIMDSFVVND